MFLGSDLLTGGHLHQFFDCGKSGTAVERFCRLEKLHLVLEIVTLLDQSLGLPRLTLSSIARFSSLVFFSSFVDCSCAA